MGMSSIASYYNSSCREISVKSKNVNFTVANRKSQETAKVTWGPWMTCRISVSINPIVVEVSQPGLKVVDWTTDWLKLQLQYQAWILSCGQGYVTELSLWHTFPSLPLFSLSFLASVSLCLPPLPVDHSVHASTMPFAVWQCSFSTRTANGFVNMSCTVIYNHHSFHRKLKKIKNCDDWLPVDLEQKSWRQQWWIFRGRLFC